MLYLVYETSKHVTGMDNFEKRGVRIWEKKEDALEDLESRVSKYVRECKEFTYSADDSEDMRYVFYPEHKDGSYFAIEVMELVLDKRGSYVPLEIAQEEGFLNQSTVIPRMRLEELCTLFKDGLVEDGEEEAYTYFRETCELSDEEAEWLGLEHWQDNEDIEDFDDSAAWEDDSDRGCKDCPPEECTGHCMSCFCRPV